MKTVEEVDKAIAEKERRLKDVTFELGGLAELLNLKKGLFSVTFGSLMIATSSTWNAVLQFGKSGATAGNVFLAILAGVFGIATIGLSSVLISTYSKKRNNLFKGVNSSKHRSLKKEKEKLEEEIQKLEDERDLLIIKPEDYEIIDTVSTVNSETKAKGKAQKFEQNEEDETLER